MFNGMKADAMWFDEFNQSVNATAHAVVAKQREGKNKLSAYSLKFKEILDRLFIQTYIGGLDMKTASMMGAEAMANQLTPQEKPKSYLGRFVEFATAVHGFIPALYFCVEHNASVGDGKIVVVPLGEYPLDGVLNRMIKTSTLLIKKSYVDDMNMDRLLDEHMASAGDKANAKVLTAICIAISQRRLRDMRESLTASRDLAVADHQEALEENKRLSRTVDSFAGRLVKAEKEERNLCARLDGLVEQRDAYERLSGNLQVDLNKAINERDNAVRERSTVCAVAMANDLSLTKKELAFMTRERDAWRIRNAETSALLDAARATAAAKSFVNDARTAQWAGKNIYVNASGSVTVTTANGKSVIVE